MKIITGLLAKELNGDTREKYCRMYEFKAPDSHAVEESINILFFDLQSKRLVALSLTLLRYQKNREYFNYQLATLEGKKEEFIKPIKTYQTKNCKGCRRAPQGKIGTGEIYCDHLLSNSKRENKCWNYLKPANAKGSVLDVEDESREEPNEVDQDLEREVIAEEEVEKLTTVINVAQDLLQQMQATNSCNEVPNGKIKKPFEYGGQLYICVGGVLRGELTFEAKCYLLTPKANYKGEIRTYKDNAGKFTYTREVVKFRKDEYVMTGNEINFTDPDAEQLWQEKYGSEPGELGVHGANQDCEGMKCDVCINREGCENFGLDQEWKCRICGCTDDMSCMTASGPCRWTQKNLCSACESKAIEIPAILETEDGRVKTSPIDFSSLTTRTATKDGEKHIFTCSGKKASGEDMREATIGLCRELGIKFENPTLLAELLKEFPQSRQLDILINNLDPVKAN
jgi:hypothetical protein